MVSLDNSDTSSCSRYVLSVLSSPVGDGRFRVPPRGMFRDEHTAPVYVRHTERDPPPWLVTDGQT